jgi:calcineurin-like phosphoesterase family protein
MRDFFTSDLHLGHGLMVDKERYDSPYRDYASRDEMDAGIITKINSQAKKGDKLYIVGDFSFRKPLETREILEQIDADAILVKGNHDHRKKNSFLSTVEYANELAEFHVYLERKFNILDASGEVKPQLIVMFHFPLMHWHKQHYGSWHLHGHLHGNPSGVPGKCLDVGWDKWGRLLSIEEISAIMATKPARGNHHEEEY